MSNGQKWYGLELLKKHYQMGMKMEYASYYLASTPEQSPIHLKYVSNFLLGKEDILTCDHKPELFRLTFNYIFTVVERDFKNSAAKCIWLAALEKA